jgi:hypothetical protein
MNGPIVSVASPASTRAISLGLTKGESFNSLTLRRLFTSQNMKASQNMKRSQDEAEA